MRITIELTEAEARSATVTPQGAMPGAARGGDNGSGSAADGGAPPEGLLLALGAAGAGGTSMAAGGGFAGPPEGLDAGRAPAWLTEMIRGLGQPRRG